MGPNGKKGENGRTVLKSRWNMTKKGNITEKNNNGILNEKEKEVTIETEMGQTARKSEPYEKCDEIWVDLACRTDIRMGQDDREI